MRIGESEMSQRHPQDDMVLHRQLHDLRTLQGALTMQ